MQVKELWIYPVKALAGMSVASATLQSRGFENDRRWMLVDENGRFISQREHAHLCRWQAAISENTLTISHLDRDETIVIPEANAVNGPLIDVQVWRDNVKARLVESHNTKALPKALGINCRLVYLAEDCHRAIDPRYAKGHEEVSFADGYPYLITTTASLDALNRELGAAPLSMRRFRPNIVLENTVPFEEDAWGRISIDDQYFRLPKICARCVVITIDPETGEKNPAVFATLAKMHSEGRKVLFGMTACWEGEGFAQLRRGNTALPA